MKVSHHDAHSHATLGKLLKVMKQSFPPVCSRDNKSTFLLGLWLKFPEIMRQKTWPVEARYNVSPYCFKEPGRVSLTLDRMEP